MMSTESSKSGSSPQPDASGQIRTPGPPRIEVPSGSDQSRVVTTPAREQEQSIRDRKNLMFDDEDLPSRAGAAGEGAAGPIVAKPFRDYLTSTPAEPLSNTAKAMLYVVGAVVLLLFLAAILKGR